MRVPIFEEISTQSFDEQSLRQVFDGSKVGRAPCYLSLMAIEIEDRMLVAKRILAILDEKKISPHFPYPFFIIVDTPLKGIDIETAASLEELPQYYVKKIKKLNNKEMALLNKVLLLNEKIANLEIYNHQKKIDEMAKEQKELFKITKERNFYQKISEKLIGSF